MQNSHIIPHFEQKKHSPHFNTKNAGYADNIMFVGGNPVVRGTTTAVVHSKKYVSFQYFINTRHSVYRHRVNFEYITKKPLCQYANRFLPCVNIILAYTRNVFRFCPACVLLKCLWNSERDTQQSVCSGLSRVSSLYCTNQIDIYADLCYNSHV